MHVINEEDLLKAVKNGACPRTILEMFDFVYVDGYFVDAKLYPQIPEHRRKLEIAMGGGNCGQSSP